MPTFAIDRDNSIRLLGPDEKPFITETPLSTLDELVGVSVTHNWSKQEVTDVWNKFATTRVECGYIAGGDNPVIYSRLL